MTQESSALSPSASWILSIFFWFGLGACAFLTALLALAPRWAESERLRLRYAENAHQIAQLQHDSKRLSQVVTALRDDPEFVSWIASSELHSVPEGGQRIRLDSSLAAESPLSLTQEVFTAAKPSPLDLKGNPGVLPWISPWLQLAADQTEVRTRLIVVDAVLLILVFLCFNEGFFAGGIGRTLCDCIGAIRRRYAVKSQ